MICVLCVICAIAALLETGFCLQCTDCISSNTDACEGLIQTCASGQVCGSQSIHISEDGKVLKSIGRNCVEPTYCDQSFSIIQNDNKKVLIFSSCCSTDLCTPPKPTTELTGNGIMCPFCHAPGMLQCHSTNIAECRGKENKCFFYDLPSGPSSSKLAARGCATEQLCAVLVGTIVPRELASGNIICTSSPSVKTMAF
ncbi:phospholipase A2 inhibitor and Ly6/PLAUR domain-containing protein-like [Discoglossus pictus]